MQRAWGVIGLELDGAAIDLSAAEPMILEFSASSLTGELGCTTVATTYTAGYDGSFAVGKMGLFDNSCADAGDGSGQSLIAALGRVRAWSLDRVGGLELTGGDARIVGAREKPVAASQAPPDAGYLGMWRLESLATPGGAVELRPANPVTLGLSRLGAGGSATCNQYVADYTSVGSDGLSFSRLTRGLKDCVPVDAVMSIEVAYLAALLTVVDWQIDAQGRLLLGGQGYDLLFTRTGPPPAVGRAPEG